MLFDLYHILYMVISGLLTAGILILAAFLIKKQKTKDLFLKFWAIITVVVHFSSIYYEYFVLKNSNPELELSMFIPAFACNVCMWMLVIVAFARKDNKLIKLASTFLALGGIVCAVVGILLNETYDSDGMTTYDSIKGLLSHSTMLVGCIYLIVGKYVKIRVNSVLGVVFGLCVLLVDGLIINLTVKLFGLPSLNSMYLESIPFEKIPWLNTLTIGIIGVVVAFIIGVIVEFVFLKKEERWYTKIKKHFAREEEISLKGENK